MLGSLSNPARLNVTASIEQLQLVLYDYEVRNNDLIQIILDQEVVQDLDLLLLSLTHRVL